MINKFNFFRFYIFKLLILVVCTSLTPSEPHKILIIGGGPAAYSAAVSAANSKLAPIVIEGQEPGGQPNKAGDIKNFPGHKTINGGDLVFNMRDHAESLGAIIIEEQVTKVDFSKSPFTVWTNQNKSFLAHAIIIATGSEPIKLNCPGEDQYWGKGVVVCAKCDGYLFKDKPVVIVGGGYSALREVGNMKAHTNNITIVNPEKELTGPQFLINQANSSGIKILNNTSVKQIIGNGKNVTGIEIVDQKTGLTSTLPTQGVLVGLGWQPNSNLFRGQVNLNNKNQIIINNETQTNLAGVYAAGDVTDKARYQLFMASSAGFAAAMDAEKYLREKNLI